MCRQTRVGELIGGGSWYKFMDQLNICRKKYADDKTGKYLGKQTNVSENSQKKTTQTNISGNSNKTTTKYRYLGNKTNISVIVKNTKQTNILGNSKKEMKQAENSNKTTNQTNILGNNNKLKSIYISEKYYQNDQTDKYLGKQKQNDQTDRYLGKQ